MGKKYTPIYSVDDKYPVPSQAELDQEPQWMLLFNDWEWKVAQSLIGSLINPDIWESYPEELDQALLGLTVPDDPIVAEWVQVYDFTDVNGGYSVVPGGGGTWVSGLGWRSTLVSGQTQVHIQKNFAATGITGLAVFFGLSTVATNVNTIEAKLLQGASEVTMFSSNPPSVSLQDLTVEGATYTNVTRLRLRLHATSTNQQAVRLIWLVVWGEGDEPL